MGHQEATPQQVPLTVLAGQYEAIKNQIAVGLRARQEASRFGATPLPDDGDRPPGRQDARRIAAQQLNAGVSHTTLEKVLWLGQVAFDMERRAVLRREAMDALEAVDGGEPVNWVYQKVHTLVLIDDLDQAAADAPAHSIVASVAARHLGLLRQAGVWGATPAMKRAARQALAHARHADNQIDRWARDAAPVWPAIQASLKQHERETQARYDQQVADRITARDAANEALYRAAAQKRNTKSHGSADLPTP